MDIWYIKLHRKILEWEWYSDSNVTRVFLHFLLIANREEKKWRGVTIPKWSLVTGRLQLSETLWLSERQIRTALTKLKTTNEIAIQTTNSFSVIEVKNWQLYQDQKTSKTTNERPTRDQRETTPKEVENIEVKNITLSNVSDSEFQKFWELYGKKVDSKKCQTAFLRLSKTEKEEIFQKLPAYINSTPEIKYRKNPLTYLHGKCWNDEPIWDAPSSGLTIDDL